MIRDVDTSLESGDEEIQFEYLTGRGTTVSRRHRFEGIIPNLERRYRETESGMVREELSKYLSVQPCPDCYGSRLTSARSLAERVRAKTDRRR